MGQNLPTAELKAVCENYQPDAIATVLTSQPERSKVGEFAHEIAVLCPDKLVVLYGPLARQEGLDLPKNCVVPALMTDFLVLVAEHEPEPVAA